MDRIISMSRSEGLGLIESDALERGFHDPPKSTIPRVSEVLSGNRKRYMSAIGFLCSGMSISYVRGPVALFSTLEDDISGWDEDAFYSEEPLVDKRVQTDELLDGSSQSLGRRQDTIGTGTTGNANANPVVAGALPVQSKQTQNVTGTTNSTPQTNTTSGTQPGYIGNAPNPNSDQVNCSDLVTGRSNDCWAQLRLTDYVNNWLENNQCYQGEGFSTCFLRQNHFPGLDCSVITPSSCPAIQSDAVNQDPRTFYVAYNIYAINAFFYSWWLAVGNSGGIAADNIGKIVQILDPPDDMKVDLQWALIAFQAVFSIIPGIAGVWASHSAFSYAFQVGAQVLSNALATVPNVGRFLFPTGSAESQVVQMADLANDFGTVLQGVQSNLNQTLVSVMANVTEFLAFAEQGNFTSKPQSLPEQAGYFNDRYYAFNTYLISQTLNGNNVYAVLGKGTDPHQLATNGSKLADDIDLKDCKTGYNSVGVCDAWWYSGNYRSAFTLDNFSHMNWNYGDKITSLLQNLTTGELLFEGAYACGAQGNFGGPVNITVDKGGVNTACISQLKVLTWDMTCHGAGAVVTQQSADCEFLEMPKQNKFWYTNGAQRGNVGPRYSVPYGYLGPAITSGRTLFRDK
ncbi:uncharacterized protein KY384_003018 [Bacidia gigantensis]|uniref:uncharacterized protein n=1 Tax=Bacidia gigantensis TaxID=2732470 RepID=UPI001D046D69|nr:uncharacterized protein KY384_003018 [Bacidia gigantensis]KAG8531389.1 hypothetical protein KY384_003018 [Bacidia gigantensis]